MSQEEGKKGEVAPEVAAAWQKLDQRLQLLQDAIGKRDLVGLSHDLKDALVWEAILDNDDVVAAFREQILKDVEFWYKYIREDIKEGEIGKALNDLRTVLNTLTHYAEFLGVEIPSEEEEEVAEEVEREDPWSLGLDEEMWDLPLPDLLGEGGDATVVCSSFAKFCSVKTAGPALKILNEEGWRPGRIRFIGPKRLILLREKFVEAGYPVPG